MACWGHVPYKFDQDQEMSEPSVRPDTSTNSADSALLMKVVRDGLVESRMEIDIQSKNPNSPLYGIKTFDGFNLKPNLLKGIYTLGFNSPSKIQQSTIPTLLADPPQNMIAQSQSGTGKTAAFLIAMLSRVDPTEDYLQVIYLSPTYELTIQTGGMAAKMSTFCPEIKLRYIVKGEELTRETKVTDHILFGTPGRMNDFSINNEEFDLKKIKLFVLDEADVIIDRHGHQDECLWIHAQLHPTCQIVLFLATYGYDVMKFAEHLVPDPIVIRLQREEESLDNIKQYYVICKTAADKLMAICNIYGTISIGQAIIFCHSKHTANWLATQLKSEGHAVGVLSSELNVEERNLVLDSFRKAQQRILVTTNVLSRGINVEQVTLVINFDMPIKQDREADCETYLHRIGRAGRFGKGGIAINLIDSPRTMKICKTIENHFRKIIQYLDIEDYEQIENILLIRSVILAN